MITGIDIVKSSFGALVVAEVQNEFTGNIRYEIRRIPDRNKDDERIVRVDNQKINVAKDYDEYLKNNDEVSRLIQTGKKYQKMER